MHKTRSFIFAAAVIVLLGGAGAAMAADDTGSRTAQDAQQPRVIPPPPPQELTKGEEIKPGVTITHRNGAEYREYSIHGRVYAMKITPRWGPPYWLYDTDGNGVLEEMRGDPLHEIPQTVQWQILTW
jgi:hypothetical protein